LRGMHMNVFSPFHDVGIGLAEDVVPADIKALEKSTVVLAMLDGMDPGTIFEIGYAVKLGIPVIGLSQNGSEEEVKMLVGTGCILVDDFATAIYRTVWAGLQA
jgi:nucleoside 2-deoxyribosyltransferase